MDKIKITKISVLNLEYKGEEMEGLERHYRYVAVVVEGCSDDGILLVIQFQNALYTKMLYNSFISFATDWIILGEFNFEEANKSVIVAKNNIAFDKAIEYVKLSHVGDSRGAKAMLLGDISELIKITTGAAWNWRELLK